MPSGPLPRRRSCIPIVLGLGCFLSLFLAGVARPESETPEDPVREMLRARFETEQSRDRPWIAGLTVPANLGLGRDELLAALEALKAALATWKIEFHPGYAAFAVQSVTRLLAVNPQSMESILEEDNDVLLHEAVHLSDSQVKRQEYGLYAELTFLQWLGDHLDEERASREMAQLNHTLSPDEILRLRLWSPSLKEEPVPLRAVGEAFRASWICEIQAYDVQMMAFDRDRRQSGGSSLKQAAGRLRQTLVSETGLPPGSDLSGEEQGLLGEDDVGLALFSSFDPKRVTDGFQEAVLSCVLFDRHKALLFATFAEAHGWSVDKARKNPVYRRHLLTWARRSLLQWDRVKTDRYTLNEKEMDELRGAGLVAGSASFRN